MAGKSSEGFTKSAQKTKFVRHRDVKMKDSELRREAHVKHAMCEGICDRCRDKVQWRHQYDKYKPLTKPATCQRCKNKSVYKAYRSLCDPCAVHAKECPACCKDMDASNLELRLAREAKGRVSASGEEADMGGQGEGDDYADDEDAMDDEERAELAVLRKKFVHSESVGGDAAAGGGGGGGVGMEVEKSDRVLQKIAATKYSKSRPAPGTAEDNVNVFGFTAET